MVQNERVALPPMGVAPQQKKKFKMKKEYWFSMFMLVPVIFHFLVFYCGVNLGSILLAFTTNTPEGDQVFSLINFENFFKELARTDSAVYMAIKNTLIYYVFGQLKFAVTILVAYFLYKKIYGHKWFKIIFFMPAMIPSMVYISVFKNFVSTYGPLYMMLEWVFDYKMPPLLAYPDTAGDVILFFHIWSGFGPQLLIQVGAMNRIPDEVIDAAKLDGCIGFREFWYIVLPLIMETVATYFLLGIVGIFQASGPFLFFVGESMPEVHTLSYWTFTQTMGGKTNYPAAIGLIFTFIALPLVIISRWGINKLDTVTY